MDCFLTYGLNLDNNQLVSINDVERGLECNCVCPKCGSKLVAKKGEERIYHFAHYDKEDCGGGQMTALHIYVQKILKERKKLLLPPCQDIKILKFLKDRTIYPLLCEKDVDVHFFNKKHNVKFDYVLLEKENTRVGSFIPDCIGYKNEHKILIEVFVTHRVDKWKIEKIRQSGLTCLELDFSSMKDDFTEEKIIKLLEEDIEHKVWINNPKYEERFIKIRDYVNKKKQEEVDEWRSREEKSKEELLKKLKDYLSGITKFDYSKLDYPDKYEKFRDLSRNSLMEIFKEKIDLNDNSYRNVVELLDWVKNRYIMGENNGFHCFAHLKLSEMFNPNNFDLMECFSQIKKQKEGAINAFCYLVHYLYTIENFEYKLPWYYYEVTPPSLLEILREICSCENYDEARVERLFIIYCYEEIRKRNDEFYLLEDEKGKPILADRDYRKLILSLVSPLFGRVLGTKFHNFASLTEYIRENRPEYAIYYIKAVESEQGRMNSYVSKKGEDKLDKLKKVLVDSHSSQCYLLEKIFPDVFKRN